MSRKLAAAISLLSASALAIGTGIALVAFANPASAVAAHSPHGALDALSRTGSVVAFSGWAVDPDLSGTVRIVVSLDKTVVSSTLANRPRPDVARVYPKYGAKRGFSASLLVPAGKHTICLVAGDLGTGADRTLGCRTFTAPRVGVTTASVNASKKPFGHLDSGSFVTATHRLTVRGWTMDPDTVAPVNVDVMIGGQSLGSAEASLPRPDVAKRYPGYGANHGFAFTVTAPFSPGNYQLCAVAVNAAAGGNTILPCKVISIRPVGEPAALNVETNATAAAAIQAQAIKSHAATASSFPTGANSATRIAIATRALLQQAVGKSTPPPVVSGIPAFKPASSTHVADEQAVMGPRPSLGSYPAVKTGGRPGIARSLQRYANDALTPPGGTGDGLIGAAPVLLANGTTVHPILPVFRAGYPTLRAEVAITAALAHIGDPYVWAAAGPQTFDCSGLMQWAYAKAGVNLAHYTGSQAQQGVRIQPSQLLPGDLVLFGGNLHHVGMYLGAGYMLDAPDTGAYIRVDKISWFGDFSLAVRP
jgi:cell wall-associated NlpC family hydrolase